MEALATVERGCGVDLANKSTDELSSEGEEVPEQGSRLASHGLKFKLCTIFVALLYLGNLTCAAIALWFVLPRYLSPSFFQFWHSHWIWEGAASLAKSFGRDVFLCQSTFPSSTFGFVSCNWNRMAPDERTAPC
jgi:hypothetical protein